MVLQTSKVCLESFKMLLKSRREYNHVIQVNKAVKKIYLSHAMLQQSLECRTPVSPSGMLSWVYPFPLFRPASSHFVGPILWRIWPKLIDVRCPVLLESHMRSWWSCCSVSGSPHRILLSIFLSYNDHLRRVWARAGSYCSCIYHFL